MVKMHILAYVLTALVTSTAAYRGSFIIEAQEDGNDGHLQLRSRDVEDALNCATTARHNYVSPFFNGRSFEVECDTSSTDEEVEKRVLASLRSHQAVKRAWKARELPRAGVTTSSETGAIRSMPERKPLDREDVAIPGLVNTKRQTPDAQDVFSPHKSTGVNQLHAEGLLGSNLRIAVIDSGFNLAGVPELENVNVVYSKDLTDNDDDVSDDGCSYHGTHVLGSLAASSSNDPRFGPIVGAAPNASYELYRIQTCPGTASQTADTLIAALLEAASRGVDIISCSFGDILMFPDDPTSAVATAIHANGTFVSISAGNGGPGVFTGASPASGQLVAAVGSTDNSLTPYYTWRANWTDGELRFVPGMPFNFTTGRDLTVWYPGPADSLQSATCNPLPEGAVLPADPANTILLIDYVHCWAADPSDLLTSVQSKLGIKYLMFYQPLDYSGVPWTTTLYPSGNPNLEGLIMLTYADAKTVAARIEAGVEVSVSISSDPAVSDMRVDYKTNDVTGDYVSDFSSWGPTPDGRMMPTFLAPGGNILSTAPASLGGWAVAGGTSQATPLLSGIAGLIREKYPELTAVEIEALLASTARPIQWNRNGSRSDFLAPVFQQGAGLVDAYRAATAVSRVNVTGLNFNDTVQRPDALSFALTNTGLEEIQYDLSHLGAASGYILSATQEYTLTRNEDLALGVFADVAITPSQVTLGPGESIDISITIIANPDLPEAATRVSYFGGYIVVNGTSSTSEESLTVPYTGFGAPLTALPMINRTETRLVATTSSDPSGATDIEASGHVFECAWNATAPSPLSCEGGYPGFALTGLFPSRKLAFDLLMSNGTALMPDVNTLEAGDYPWISSWAWYTDGTDAGGIFIPEDAYVWRVRSLRLNGDEANVDDWDVWTSGEWSVAYVNSTVQP